MQSVGLICQWKTNDWVHPTCRLVILSEWYCSFSIWLHSVALHNESQAWSSASVSMHLWANLRFYTWQHWKGEGKGNFVKMCIHCYKVNISQFSHPGQLAQKSISSIVYAINPVDLIDCKDWVSASSPAVWLFHIVQTLIVSETWASLSFTPCHDFSRLS